MLADGWFIAINHHRRGGEMKTRFRFESTSSAIGGFVVLGASQNTLELDN